MTNRLLAMWTSLLVAAMPVSAQGLRSIEGATQVVSVASADAALTRNKANVLAFYSMAFNDNLPAQAMQRYGGATYTQHNPEVADGREAFVAFFEQMAKEHPGKRINFKRVLAEGDQVVVHSEHVFPGLFGGSWAAMDWFRLDGDGKIVEHWDALQKVPAKSANANGVF